MGRLIRFDKRGTGMSDRPSGIPDLETRMHDVLAVMDAAGSRRAVLIGYSEGGPMAILLAAMHPSRVSSLVLYGSYARRTWAPDYPYPQTAEERAVYTEQLVTGWDWEADMRMRTPSADVAMQRWWARRMRAAATPGTVRALMNMNDSVDVRQVLPSVQVPTLVLHRRRGRAVLRRRGESTSPSGSLAPSCASSKVPTTSSPAIPNSSSTPSSPSSPPITPRRNAPRSQRSPYPPGPPPTRWPSCS